MRLLLRRFRNVWKRLLLLVGAIVFILWANLAAALYLLWNAQGNYQVLVDTEVPRLVLVGELSRYSADLAALATSVLSGRAGNGAFVAEIEAIEDGIRTVLEASGKAGQAGYDLIGGDGLNRTLREVLNAAQAQLGVAALMDAQVDTLRWLNIDIQDEVEPVLRDLDYNIASRMLELQQADSSEVRQSLAEIIADERARRDIFAEIGSDAATAMTLVVQVAVADDAERVAQLETLLHDFRARLSERLQSLPQAPELVTLRQSIDRLFGLFEGDASMIAHRRQWIESRDQAYEAISATLAEIDAVQGRLADLSESERQEVLERIESAADRVKTMAVWLIGVTSLVVGFGALGIDRLIRTRIVVPMRALSDRLMATAEAGSGPQDGDDLARLTFAVGEFQRAITERDRAIADLRRTQDELVQAGKMAALGALSAGISHEINQPLGAISYRMSLLDQAARAGNLHEVLRQAELVGALSERIQRIIQHLRRFARRGKFEQTTLSLADVVSNASKLLDARVRETGVALVCDVSLDQARVTADPILTEQVVLNVLTNAIDAVVDLGPNPPPERRRIIISAEPEGPNWNLYVKDLGIGLGGLGADAVMMPFVSSKEAGRGMGLGLSISYNIARDMGGDLSLADRPDGLGAAAIFRLPKAEGALTDG